MNTQASSLIGLESERVALCDVSVSAVLQDLLAEVEVSQTYRNDELVNIEAVYTFPLPLDAVLLELEVDIGGRVLRGVVVEKKAAEEQYEDAVEAGDAAVMLEVIEPGLYTMNVGNLLPQETARITFRYALLYRWTGDQLRFFLPTTIAPRFGESSHLPHQIPESSLMVENQFSLRVEVFGTLCDAQFDCPSHAIEYSRAPDKAVLSLQQTKAVMDRDFILNVRAPQATRSFVLCGQDDEGTAAIASFQPFFPGLQARRPLSLAIVIDCSGSMGGDSMEQARLALDGILNHLQPKDRMTLIAFGDRTCAWSKHLLPCTSANLSLARRFAGSLDANLGGTEIGHALEVAYTALGDAEAGDLFLVTDGEVYAWEEVVGRAKNAGHRIFPVGVGHAVSESFLRKLAVATGGECEFVSPQEGMADRVVRHFERLRAPCTKRVIVHWPPGATHISPSRMGAVFEGDTVVASASFEQGPTGGCVILEIETVSGETVRQELAFPAAPLARSPDGPSTVARVAAAMRLQEADASAGLSLALRYRLVSPWTNWLVVATRPEAEKALNLPALRKVPQTIAAGWGGLGSVDMTTGSGTVASPSVPYLADFTLSEFADIRFLKRQAEASPIEPESPDLPIDLPIDLPQSYHRLVELVHADPAQLDIAFALELLTRSGLAGRFDELFQQATDLGLDVDTIAAIVVVRLLVGPLREFVSGDALAALVSLQEHTLETMEGLREQEILRELFDQLDDAVQGTSES